MYEIKGWHIAALVLLAGGTLYFASVKTPPPAPQYYAVQLNEENGVSVEVQPVPGEPEWAFQISMNTHSGSLETDLARSADLTLNGITYSALGWEGDPPSGHHINGTLYFKPLSPARSFTLVLKNVGGVPERKFVWDNE